MNCPRCKSEAVVKHGHNVSGTTRYLCKGCRRHFTPEPGLNGYPKDIRQQAIEMAVDGQGFRRIARNLKVNHQSVAKWVKQAGERAAAAAIPRPEMDGTDTVELDELFTFVAKKKTRSTSSRKSTGKRAAS